MAFLYHKCPPPIWSPKMLVSSLSTLAGMGLDWDLRYGGSLSQGFCIHQPFPSHSIFLNSQLLLPNFTLPTFPSIILCSTNQGSTFQPSVSSTAQLKEPTAPSTSEAKRRVGKTDIECFLFCCIVSCVERVICTQGACGFLPRLINYNPFALIRQAFHWWDANLSYNGQLWQVFGTCVGTNMWQICKWYDSMKGG